MAIIGLTVDIANQTMTIDRQLVLDNKTYYAVVNNHFIRRGQIKSIQFDLSTNKPQVTFTDNQNSTFTFDYDADFIYASLDDAKALATSNFAEQLEAQADKETKVPL